MSSQDKHYIKPGGKQQKYRINPLKLLMTVIGFLLVATILIWDELHFFAAQPTQTTGVLPAAQSPPLPSPSPEAPQNAFSSSLSYLVLVNWEHPTADVRPSNLIQLDQVFQDEVLLANPEGSLHQEAAQAAKAMFRSALNENITKFKIHSAYRSPAYQNTLWEKKISADPNYGQNPFEHPVSVMPGNCSEHATSLAIDILSADYSSLDEGFEATPEGLWLAENAHRFGFILRYPKNKEHLTGVVYEPWHFRYVGIQAANEMFQQGKCLEEYLKCQ